LERVTQDLLSIFGKDKLLKMMTPEERISGLTPEERVRGLSEEDIRGLTPQTREKLKQILLNQSEPS